MTKRKKKARSKKRKSRTKIADVVTIKRGIMNSDAIEKDQQQEKSLLATMTGELYHLVRIYYSVFDKDKLLQNLSRLQCIEHDPPRNRWVWLFDGETKNLSLPKPYRSIPKNLQPIVLGSFFFKNDREIYLNTNSFDRATSAIEFFDKHIDRTVFKATEMTIVNKLFEVSLKGPPPSHEAYMDQKQDIRKDPQTLLNRAAMIGASVSDPIKRANLALSLLMNSAKEPLPLVETFPLDAYYEDGITSINLPLNTRNIITMRHFQGDTDFSLVDLMEKLIK